MARYTVECDSCSKEMDFNTFGGNSRDRQWRADHWSHECDECKETRIKAENEKNAQKNREEGLPLLVGSEKQISWAETIRGKLVIESSLFIEKSELVYTKLLEVAEPLTKRIIMRAMMDVDFSLHNRNFIFGNSLEKVHYKITRLFENTSASFWIDSRGIELYELLENIEDEDIEAQQELEKNQQKEAELEATIRPKIALSETVAYIFSESEEKLCIEFPEKRDDFRTLVKAHGFSWGNGRWYRNLSITTGSKEDRISEMGNLFLTEGFIIRIFDEELRQKAIDGSYEPEHTRWIKFYKGKFSIKWKRYSEDFYEEARRIPTSKWDNPTVDVKAEQFEAVLDFANEYDFRLSQGALELVEESRRAKEAQLIPTVKKGADAKSANMKQRDFNIHSVDIDDELVD
jgi:hypothetical protein